VVRLSGPDAFDVLRRVCPGLGEAPDDRRATLADVLDPETGEVLDRGLVTVFAGPASYTGEDVVEISCHGGHLGPELVIDACLRAGARGADAGEFTRRAYLGGKLDLVQAEAVADLVEGRSRALRDAAFHQLDRGLSDRIAGLREELVELEAFLTHHIDFPEEDEPPVELERVASRAEEVVETLESFLATAPEGELLREGAVTVLAGRPNTGKSRLFNALLGTERAIVTEVPGTTRDALEAVVSVEGFPFRLVDTAGLRETDDRVEEMGIEVARRYLEAADLVLLCVEASAGVREEERRFLEGVEDAPVIVVRTKADLMGDGGSFSSVEVTEGSSVEGEVTVSALTGRGLQDLRKLLPRLVYRGLVEGRAGSPVLTRKRHARGIRRARNEIRAFVAALRDGVPAEVASTHLRPAETALEEILGVISPDDVLDRVFREFCIGK